MIDKSRSRCLKFNFIFFKKENEENVTENGKE